MDTHMTPEQEQAEGEKLEAENSFPNVDQRKKAEVPTVVAPQPMPKCPHDLTVMEYATLPGGSHPAHRCPACGTVYTAEHLTRLNVA